MNPTFQSSSLARVRAALTSVTLWLLVGTASAQALVDISTLPLFGGRQPNPNVTVALSVEFPTVKAAYGSTAYVRGTPYLGYFNYLRCYEYLTSNGGFFSVKTGTTGVADANLECSGGLFAGSFMNWVTMSAIDEFRFAMTGGNRTNENGPNGGTIIDRAYLPDGMVPGVPGNTADGYGFYAAPAGPLGIYSNDYFPRHGIGLNGGLDNDLSVGVLINKVLGISGVPNSGVVFITNCKSQVYFGPTYIGSCSYPDNSYGAYNVRVNVCDANEGLQRSDLCLQYGTNGKYKPVGQVQINAAQMRFAAFGYLMDRTTGSYNNPCENVFVPTVGWNFCRYGGVLRAPMKYVGPMTYDANQVPFTNTKSEINTDGSLVMDPEGTASSAGGTNSGFINYINKFGSGTNAGNPGVGGIYKRFDPGGEMFYEAIRYYQNLGPTALATASLPSTTPELNAIKDYYPITTTWTDPISSICAPNYIVNLSDANMWTDSYVPGFKGVPSGGISYTRPSSRAVEGGLDAVAWTKNIGLLEATMPSIATLDVDPALSGLETRFFAAGQAGTYFAAGMAYWANVNDIRADLTGVQTIKTISFDVGEATTLPIYERQLYLMGKYGGFKNTIDRTTTANGGPDTFANPFYALDPSNPQGIAIRSNSEWADSTTQPTNYVLASNPTKLINGIRAAFANIGTPSGTLSGAALSSANLTFGAAGAYVATFSPSKWSGSVLYDSLSVDTNGNLVVSPKPIWDSGDLLNARCGTVASGSTVCTDTSSAANKRSIFTTISLSNVRTAAPFTVAGITPDATYLAALNTSHATNTVDGQSTARLNYLRGYRADEGSTLAFRLRDSPMGDIVNSGPVYVGAPTSGIPDSDYQPFYMTNAARAPTVYFGANDGMLHAIDASTGMETFAYVPGYSVPDLSALSDPGYVHETYVDTVPKVQEVKVGTVWKTVLVGANGNGVQGVFGLDVSSPTAFGASNVLFEFSDADDADFGSVISAPEIAKLWVSGTSASPVYRYFAVVTGYNKMRTKVNGRTDTKVSTDTLNNGTLFLIALDHVLGTSWSLNSDYYKFNFPASSPSLANGLAPVTLLPSKSGDQTTAAMYFGDLQGNLWKLNTNTGNPSTWAPALGTTAIPLPIFIAQDNNGNRQPITARVELAGGPFGSTLVYFGTGRYLGATDLTLPGSVQSEYSLLDLNPSVSIQRPTDLVARVGTISGFTVNITGAAFSYSGTSAKKGWYLDFPSSIGTTGNVGERSVTKPAIRTGLLTFTTLTLSNDLCLPGNGYIYQVNALTGLPYASNGTTGGYASTVGIPGPPRVVDLTVASGQTQSTGEVINKKTQVTLVSGTAGKIAGYGDQSQHPVPPTQEINWREITNYNDRAHP